MLWLINLVSNICESWEKKIWERKEKSGDVMIGVKNKGEKKEREITNFYSFLKI
jgi:hypothetical protein